VAAQARSTRRRVGTWFSVTLAVALAGLALWSRRAPEVVSVPATSKQPPHAQPAVVLEHAGDGVPIMPAQAAAPVPEGPMHPHPITPAHERIYRENNLIGALNLAVDLADPSRIREVLARYRLEYPEDDHRLQDGYAIIAACLERLDDATRERAQHFWNTEIRSQTRRYVRRYCLES